MNIQFQMLDVKVRLAVAILYKAWADSKSIKELNVSNNESKRLNFWERVARFYDANFENFSDDKIMEIFKIAKRNGFTAFTGTPVKASVDAKYVINSTKYFHSSGVYEYELKTAQDWKRNTKIARWGVIAAGLVFGIQLPMDA